MTKWIKCSERLPDCEKVLATYVSDPKRTYNMRANGWFRDNIYACKIIKMGGLNKFIIESHGPVLPATHWMPLPPPPEKDE